MFDYWRIKCEKRERVGSEYSVNPCHLTMDHDWSLGVWKRGVLQGALGKPTRCLVISDTGAASGILDIKCAPFPLVSAARNVWLYIRSGELPAM